MPKDLSAAWKTRHQRWLRYVQANIKAMDSGEGDSPRTIRQAAGGAGGDGGQRVALKVVVCSPHPDDEALVGALPLRLGRECGAKVTNCAITLGSNPSQRARRLRELKAACPALGFDLAVPALPGALTISISTTARITRRNGPPKCACSASAGAGETRRGLCSARCGLQHNAHRDTLPCGGCLGRLPGAVGPRSYYPLSRPSTGIKTRSPI